MLAKRLLAQGGWITDRILGIDLLGRHIWPVLNVRHLIEQWRYQLWFTAVDKLRCTIVVGKQAS
jgi:hypothetical protein